MPTTLTRIVRTGLSSTVSTPAIAAQWTMCVAPRASSLHRVGVEDVGLVEPEVRMLGERRAGERVAVQVVERDDLVRVDEPRASVVPMNPAPPVMKIRFPSVPPRRAYPLDADSIAARVEGTVFLVGAGRHQRRAIERARELGLRVVAVDRNPDAPGLAGADVGEVVDFTDVERSRRSGGATASTAC